MAYSTYQARNGVGVTGNFGGTLVFDGIGGNGYEMPNMDDYYTKQQCDEKFALKGEGGSGGSVDLSSYATKVELDTKIQEVEEKIPEEQDLSNYATKDELPDTSTFLTNNGPQTIALNDSSQNGLLIYYDPALDITENATFLACNIYANSGIFKLDIQGLSSFLNLEKI